MALPRVYADFQNADVKGRLRLTCRGTEEDLARQNISLEEGIELLFTCEDIETPGVVEFSTEENIWVAVIDWDAIRASEP